MKFSIDYGDEVLLYSISFLGVDKCLRLAFYDRGGRTFAEAEDGTVLEVLPHKDQDLLFAFRVHRLGDQLYQWLSDIEI